MPLKPCMLLVALISNITPLYAVPYSARGNLLTDSGGNHYQYNISNQLIEDQTSHVQAVMYQYYATGEQASEKGFSKTAPHYPTIYHYYAGQGQLIDSSQRSIFAGYLFAHHTLLRALNTSQHVTVQLLFYNRHDSVIGTLQANSLVPYQYTAYGAPVLFTINPHKGIVRNPLGYSGYYFDRTTGLAYLNARYYLPMSRTFLSRDSYVLSNQYHYVNGDQFLILVYGYDTMPEMFNKQR